MKWKKEILLIMLGLVMIRMSSGALTNVTEFDDGCSNCNISENSSFFITFPSSVTVTTSNISLKSFLINEETTNSSRSGLTVTNSNGDDIVCVRSATTYTNTLRYSRINLAVETCEPNLNYNCLGRFEIWSGNSTRPNTNLYNSSVRSFLNLQTTTFQEVIENVSLPITNASYVYACMHNVGDIRLNVREGDSGSYTYLQTINNGTSWANSAPRGMNVTYFNFSYPQNVSIWINNTRVFNEPGNLSGTNASIELNSTLINNTVSGNSRLPLNITGINFGVLNIFNITFTYNRTLNAILSFNSPAQITQSISSGSSFTQLVNISNTGNYNATNISFETISQSATPNLNDSITDDCINITNSTSIVCNVTFSGITQSAEPDEKIRVRAIGTDNNDLIFSSGIDLDVTVTTPTQSVGGGGGGGGQPSKCEWRVYRPANRVINALGYSGYKTAPISFQIYNNESQPVSFTYFVQGISCQIEKNTELIQGSSFGLNTIQCDYPIKEDTGQIIVLGGSCSQSIDVKLSSSELGLGLTYLSGGAGIIPALLLYGIGALALIFTFKIMQ